MTSVGTTLARGTTLLVAGWASAALAADVDEAAAQALARESGCLKCHSTTRDKDGPSYQKVAAKYKGQADAQQKLVAYISRETTVRVDGKETKHEALDTKNEADIRNVAGWILTR